jgi:hypothetical protein
MFALLLLDGRPERPEPPASRPPRGDPRREIPLVLAGACTLGGAVAGGWEGFGAIVAAAVLLRIGVGPLTPMAGSLRDHRQ